VSASHEPSPAEPSPQVTKADVAVVFVHGIGEQLRGATLLNWAEPLLAVLDAGGGSHGLQARVASVRDLGGDAPEVVFELRRRGGARATWWLAEVRWAEAFRPSPASDVLSWAVRFSVRAARRTGRVLWDQLMFTFRERIGPIHEQASKIAGAFNPLYSSMFVVLWASVVLTYVVALVMIVLMAVLLFVVSPIAVALAAAALLALIVLQRVPVVGKRVAPLVSSLVTSIGDAQAYREREIQAVAMRQVLLDRLTQAAGRADRLVVVAHSQGAAIACKALLDGLAPWPDCLITVGTGTSLLNQEDTVARWPGQEKARWINVWTPLDPVPSGPMGDTPRAVSDRLLETMWHDAYAEEAFHVTSADGLRRLTWSPGASPDCWSGDDELVDQARRCRTSLGFVSLHETVSTDKLTLRGARAIAGFLLPTVDTSMDHLFPPDSRPRPEAPQWESFTPVRTFETPGPEEWPVINRQSIARDHTTYCANLTQVQYPLACLLLDLVPGTTNALPALTEHVTDLHTFRVRTLAASRVIAAGAAAAVIGLLTDLHATAEVFGVARRVSQGSKSASWILTHLSDNLGTWAALAAVGLTAYAALSAMLAGTWKGWQHKEALRLCRDAAGPRLRLSPGGWTFAVLYLCALGLSTAYWTVILHPDASTLPRLLAALLLVSYLGWGLFSPFLGVRPRRLPARP
jgi:hypothetical protein